MERARLLHRASLPAAWSASAAASASAGRLFPKPDRGTNGKAIRAAYYERRKSEPANSSIANAEGVPLRESSVDGRLVASKSAPAQPQRAGASSNTSAGGSSSMRVLTAADIQSAIRDVQVQLAIFRMRLPITKRPSSANK